MKPCFSQHISEVPGCVDTSPFQVSLTVSSILPGKCRFSNLWLEDERFKLWVASMSDPSRAKCTLCQQHFDVGHMWVRALSSQSVVIVQNLFFSRP